MPESDYAAAAYPPWSSQGEVLVKCLRWQHQQRSPSGNVASEWTASPVNGMASWPALGWSALHGARSPAGSVASQRPVRCPADWMAFGWRAPHGVGPILDGLLPGLMTGWVASGVMSLHVRLMALDSVPPSMVLAAFGAGCAQSYVDFWHTNLRQKLPDRHRSCPILRLSTQHQRRADSFVKPKRRAQMPSGPSFVLHCQRCAQNWDASGIAALCTQHLSAPERSPGLYPEELTCLGSHGS